MKKAVLAFVFAILTSANAQAFEFHGIKSGMSKEAVSAALTSLGVAQDKYNQVDLLTGDIESLKGVKHSPIMLSFTYNDKDQLYKMQVNYRGDLSTPRGLGLKLALEDRYKAEVKETAIKFYSISIESLVILLVDEKILNSTIARYKEKYLSEL